MPDLSKEDQENLTIFKNLILHSLEVARKDELKNLRNLNFDNGFIEGVLCSTHFLLECLSETEDIVEVEIGLVGFHRASHTLLGELTKEGGKCGLVKKNERRTLNRLIAQAILEAAVGVSVKEKIPSSNPFGPSGKPN